MWLYDDKPYEEIGDYIGFVYRITNLTNNRMYIGKKNFYFSKTKTVKGKKKRFKVESDWRSYYGSNKELAADVTLHGEGNFKRDILRLCKSKGETSYYEARFQFEYDVLLKPDEWYNGWISCRIRSIHLRHLLPEV